MASRDNRPLKVIVFNANCVRRLLHELSKHVQDLHIDVTLFTETHLALSLRGPRLPSTDILVTSG
jgi:glycine cleavage system aminomethyltransferase T